jgi:hypothetical protein
VTSRTRTTEVHHCRLSIDTEILRGWCGERFHLQGQKGDGWSTLDLNECRDRRLAELEFIEAAYDPENDPENEAWHDVNATGDPVVHRIFSLQNPSGDGNSCITICLSLTLPLTYPMGEESLHAAARLLLT